MHRSVACFLVSLAATIVTADEPTALPLRKVVLFNSGLGYFEHEKQVEGIANIEMQVDKSDINDLLKSLIVQDLNGGQISTVSFPSMFPLHDQLRNLSVDLTGQPTLGELIHQLRGEEIKLDEGKITGVILGVELKPQNVNQQVTNREVLNILTEKGFQAVLLDSVSSLQLVNEKLDSELRNALRLLVEGRRVDKKAVRFKFTGEGKRTIRIGYIRETPIWKTSYRVVLEKDHPSLLQGWAIVENNSECDWDNVEMTLTSGRPVTFQMDLYRPILARRESMLPSVPPSLASRTYSPALDKLDMDVSVATIPPANRGQDYSPTSGEPGVGLRYGVGGGFAGGGMGGLGGSLGGGELVGKNTATPFHASDGVVAQASASEVGEQFQYKIAMPVSLPQRQSAMIPIVDQDLKTEKRSIFTVGSDKQHPMLAFRMTNTTDLKLTGGPITVFDEGAYAGDARTESLLPGENRLINYAQDVDLTVRHVLDDESRKLSQASLSLGTVILTYELRREHRYRIQSKSNERRNLILEQPRGKLDWKLEAQDQPAEKTDDFYRFELVVPTEETVDFVVSEVKTDEQQFPLKAIDIAALVGLARRADLPKDVSDVIERVRHLRVGIADLVGKLKPKQALLADITNEQARIRNNISSLDHQSELYRQYVGKLTAQEGKLDRVLQEIDEMRVKQVEMERDLAKYFPSTNLEQVNPDSNVDPFR